MPKATDMRATFVATTAELLQLYGFQAAGINQIIEKSKAPKGSLYYYFPGGKEEIALEAIQQAGATLAAELQAIFSEHGNLGFAHILGLVVKIFAERLQTSDFQKGCPVATVVLETAAFNDQLQVACQQVYHSWLALIDGALVQFGYTPARAQSLALILLASIEGGLVLAKAERSVEPLLKIGQELTRLLD